MAAKKSEDNKTLEENMKSLEEIIAKLQTGELTLEQAFETYKEGMDLLLKCNASIDKVEKELVKLESEGI